MLRRADLRHGQLAVGACVGWVEDVEAEADTENAGKRAIDVRGGQQTALDSKRNIGLELGVIRVVAGLDRKRGGEDWVFRQALTGLIGVGAGARKERDRAKIIRYEAIKSPLTSKDVGEEAMVHRVRCAVHGVVRGHER